MKIVNKLIDILYDFFVYIVLLLVLSIAVVVILWRFNAMYEESLQDIEQNRIVSNEETELSILKANTEIKIIIPQGTNAIGIIKVLNSYGLNFDSEKLLSKLEKINERELPSGEYSLPLDSSNDDIERVLGLN